jgi:hypothetical protein
MSADDEDHGAALALIESGSDLAGAAAGGAAGFLVGGPGGAAAGGAGGVLLTRTLRRMGREVIHWRMGALEEVRVGAATDFAFDSIRARIMAGEVPRDDAPWREDAGRGRSAAEEVFEGVLRAAAESWEQRKVRYIGLLFASLAFRPDVDPAYANILLRLGQRLGYRALLLVAFFGRHTGENGLIEIDIARDEAGRLPLPAGLAHDLDEIGELGLLGVYNKQHTAVLLAAQTAGGPSLAMQHRLGQLTLTATGQDLHDLMRLDTVQGAELSEIWAGLRRSAGSFN